MNDLATGLATQMDTVLASTKRLSDDLIGKEFEILINQV
jgi:hypothetical protein